jgi:hypothetical protein
MRSRPYAMLLFGRSFARGCLVILRAVWICEQCGETDLEEKEIDAEQDLLQAIEPRARALVDST